MTTTDTPKTDADYEREWLASYLPLPTFDDIAIPIVRAIHQLHDLGEVGHAIANTSGDPAAVAEVMAECVDTVRRVTELVTVMAGRCTAGERQRDEVERAMRLVVETITRWPDVIAHHAEPEILSICYDLPLLD